MNIPSFLYTGFVFFIVLSVLVLIHELGHFFAAKKNGVKVEEFGFGLPPRIKGIRFGETLYSINWLPFGGFVKVFGEEEAELSGKKISSALKKRSFAHKKHWQKAIILTAGVIMNFILGWIIMSYLITKGLPVPTGEVIITNISPDSPAAEAGIQENDIITGITSNGKLTDIENSQVLISTTNNNLDKEISITLDRGGEEVTVSATPRSNPPEGEGALGIGINDGFEILQCSGLKAAVCGLTYSADVTFRIAKELPVILVKFLTFQKQEAEILGPVGIAKATGDAARVSFDALLHITGILSLNLAVVNILPFPALDGGRLVMVIYEWVTRRKVNPTIERKLNLAGFLILISLIIVITFNDIVKLF